MKASAIIVTRGDVDLAPIIGQEWPDAVDEIVIWDNSKDDDLAVYGRYAAIEKAKNTLIYVQDDDVVLLRESIRKITESCEFHQGEVVVCNMPAAFRDQPQYERGDQGLVGFGACFHRDAPCRAFGHLFLNEDCINPTLGEGFMEATMTQHGQTWHVNGDHFHRTCDIVFTALTPRVFVDVPYENLPWAEAENRMWKQPEHVAERMRMLELVRKVRGED